MQYINPYDYNALQLYGTYVKYIINDMDKGDSLLRKALTLNDSKINKMQNFYGKETSELMSSNTGVIHMSASPD